MAAWAHLQRRCVILDTNGRFKNESRLALLSADQAVGVRMLFALLRSVIRARAGRVPRRACRETAACLYLGVRTQHVRRDATGTHDPAAPSER